MKLVLAAALAGMLWGCASYDGRGLIPGQSTETQVEAVMGPSVDRRAGPNGETHRYYSRLPYGGEIYVARIGPDGKLRAIEQRLTEENFAKVKPGVSRAEEMRALFGPPYRIQQFPRMEREIWEYPWRGPTSNRLLLLQYSSDGIVREVYTIEDPGGVGNEGDGA